MTPPRPTGRPKDKTLSEIQPRNGVRIDFTDEAATGPAQAAASCKSDAPSVSTTHAMSSDSEQANQAGATQPGECPAFRFFTVDNPEKFREREGMRENRSHVMRDWLTKERQRPESTDIRVRGPRSRNKRRRSTPPTSDAPSDHSIIQQPRQQTSPNAPRRKSRRVISPTPLLPSADECNGEVPGQKTIPRALSHTCSLHERRLASLQSPSPVARLGWQLNPFHVFATFADPSLNTERLQWNRKRHFTNDASAISCHAKWVRILASENYAPLSTLCYSSAHDDIMSRGICGTRQRSCYESIDCMKVRQEIVELVNKAMRDPKKQTSDATILAVMNLVYSEIMGQEQKWLLAHRKGLHDLVLRRGGLDRLGGSGQLSCVVAIAMYLSSALRETRPLDLYVTWANARITNPGDSATDLAQSPIYARQSGVTIISGASLPDEIPELIEMSRLATKCFVVRGSTDTSVLGNSSFSDAGSASNQADPDEALFDLLDQIRAAKDAEQIRTSFATQNAKYTYEAIRLASCLYAYALAHKVPFSTAAAALSSPGQPAFHTLIKNAVANTNISECWDSMIGLLLWITLIGGASANPTAAADKSPHGMINEEADEDRRWLAAVSVRCCILLNSAHYGDHVLDTLRRLVEIESALAQSHGESHSCRGSSSSLWGSPGSTAVVVGFPSRRNYEYRSVSPDSQGWSGNDDRPRAVPVTSSSLGSMMTFSLVS